MSYILSVRSCCQYTIENIEGAIKNGQFRETGNIGYIMRKKTTTQYMLDTTMRKQTQIM